VVHPADRRCPGSRRGRRLAVTPHP